MKRFVHEKSAMDMLEEFERKRYELQSSKDIEASWEDDEDSWVMLSHKDIYDWDGFLTDYTLWYNEETGEYATFYGDRDIYNPYNDIEPDMTFDDEDEAWDWFYDYSTQQDGEDVE